MAGFLDLSKGHPGILQGGQFMNGNERKKSRDEKIADFIKSQVQQGIRLEDALRKINYIRVSEAMKLADRMETARRQG